MSESAKAASTAAVRRVSGQLKAPEPRMTRTRWARRMMMSAIAGIVQKTTCRTAAQVSSMNFSRSLEAQSPASEGKSAVA